MCFVCMGFFAFSIHQHRWDFWCTLKSIKNGLSFNDQAFEIEACESICTSVLFVLLNLDQKVADCDL